MEEESKNGFAAFKLNKPLLAAIEQLGWHQPTPVQEKVIPLALEGHDVLGIAQTGTGKTAAYLLPLLARLKYAQSPFPRALIVAPTRELVMQIADHFKQLAAYTDLRCVALYGGVGMKAQLEAIKAGTDAVVATPGRLMDIYRTGEMVVKEIKIFVLDEADKLMDMGFMPQIRRMLEILPRKRQNLLFSATMPEKVVRLSEEFLEAPVQVEITPSATTAETIAQQLYYVPNLKTKVNLLAYLFEHEKLERVIIFCRTRQNAENIGKFIARKITPHLRIIHANKGQNARINAMKQFREGSLRVLVATDVAARGIDISQVSHVINFDVPLVYEDYVHRIGRTGRAGQEGIAITFCNPAEKYHIEKIQQLIRQAIPVVPLPENIDIPPTPFEEQQAIAREIDRQKRRENPDYQGAFHEKKSSKAQKPHKSNARKIAHRKAAKKRK
ncbi:MAG: DEAD/DEAH box helicase [Cytophagales bacterium]|nr:DEAD/DEAH box helicase [Bernardetiaceae bacterium]MDW8210080.1 DEAD/DEAH box helicase [Cytophagales bacterium]